MKHNLDTMAEKLIESVEIGYYLAMDSFKNEAKKRDFSEYYFGYSSNSSLFTCSNLERG